MLSLEEAQNRLLALAPKCKASMLAITPVSKHRYLASDITALRTQPAADLSAMDGYAIAPGSGPWTLIGESRAGLPFDGALEPGQCVRISTGAHMPDGSDRVLIQENAETVGDMVATSEHPSSSQHFRKAGFDFDKGETILKQGDLCTPAALALAASAGHAELPVLDPPSICVLDSGDELVPVGTPPEPHQIPASNGLMLGAMLSPYVGSVDLLGPVADDRDALARALKRAEDCQILITSGGASVGDHDLIQQALIDWGADIAFWKVAIKPGKPLMVATRQNNSGTQVILGLPGNPVSSFVTAFLFALPLVRVAMGAPSPLPQTSIVTAGDDLPEVGKRREFLRGLSDGRTVTLAGSQDSSAMRALGSANCLIDRRAGAPAIKAGAPVPVFNLQNG